MSELPDEIPAAVEPEPRESAAGIVVRRSGRGWDVLLGRRSRRSRFLPGHLAFPGGGLEPVDRPEADGAHARCIAREMAEETALRIPQGAWLPAGVRVTPPMFPLRFRTEFFLAELPASGLPEKAPAPQEVEELRLVDPAAVLEEWSSRRCRIPPPALPILRALADAGNASLTELAPAIASVNRVEQRAPRIEFSPGTWMLPVRTRTLPPATHTNVWMPGGRRFVIIDPGSEDEAENRRLLEVVERRRKLGQQPMAVVLTHAHRDHVGGVPAVARSLDVPVRAHSDVLRKLPQEPRAGGPRQPIEDGEQLDLEGLVLRAIHTPGHAAGHLAFEIDGTGELIAGDLISGLSTILIDPEGGDMGAYLSSLERVRGLDCRTVLPAHGPPLPGKAVTALLAHRRERERALVQELAEVGRPLSEIAERIYRDVPEMPPALTQRQALSHLLHLERRGKARRVDATGECWIRGSEA